VKIHIPAGGSVDGSERFASKVKLTKAQRAAGESDSVRGNGGLESDYLFAPRKCLAFAGEFGDLRHDPASGGILWVELKHMPRDESGTLIIALPKKILRLLGEVLFPPGAITAVSTEGQDRGESADREAAHPAPQKIAPLQRANVPEAIVTSGIFHGV
jgi:hypothetical protein